MPHTCGLGLSVLGGGNVAVGAVWEESVLALGEEAGGGERLAELKEVVGRLVWREGRAYPSHLQKRRRRHSQRRLLQGQPWSNRGLFRVSLACLWVRLSTHRQLDDGWVGASTSSVQRLARSRVAARLESLAGKDGQRVAPGAVTSTRRVQVACWAGVVLAGEAGRAGRGAVRSGQLADSRRVAGSGLAWHTVSAGVNASQAQERYLFVVRAFGRRAMHSSQRRDPEGGVKIGSQALQRRRRVERRTERRTCTASDRQLREREEELHGAGAIVASKQQSRSRRLEAGWGDARPSEAQGQGTSRPGPSKSAAQPSRDGV